MLFSLYVAIISSRYVKDVSMLDDHLIPFCTFLWDMSQKCLNVALHLKMDTTHNIYNILHSKKYKETIQEQVLASEFTRVIHIHYLFKQNEAFSRL